MSFINKSNIQIAENEITIAILTLFKQISKQEPRVIKNSIAQNSASLFRKVWKNTEETLEYSQHYGCAEQRRKSQGDDRPGTNVH